MNNTLNRHRNADGTYRYVWDDGAVHIKKSRRRYDAYQTYQIPAHFIRGPRETVTMGQTKASHLRQFWTGSYSIDGDD